MAYVDWVIRGLELVTCNCDFSCPCQFNALPTNGDCKAALGLRIDEGHFGGVRLDGLKVAALVAWPGPIHEGRGECQPIVDRSASEAQRSAVLTIMSGQETAPGTTFFNVFAATYDRVHDPLFLDIELEGDYDGRTGRLSIPGVVEATAAPIRNPVTGEPHEARVILPRGFEYHEAQFADSTTRVQRPMEFGWRSGHAHLARLHMTNAGVVH